MSVLPIAVHASDITVLVVGGGRVGSRKARAFLDAGATVRVIAPEISAELRDFPAARGRLQLLRRIYRAGDMDGATLVVAATNDAAVNEQVASDAESAGKLVNRTDEPAGGTFSTMAVHRAGELAIGVVAGVPGASARVRDALAQRFDARYAEALSVLGERRALLLARGQSDSWRAAADDLLSADFCADVESGRFQAKVAAWR